MTILPKIITIKKAAKLLKNQTQLDYSIELRVAVQNGQITAAQDFPCFSMSSINHLTGESSSYYAKPRIEDIKKDAAIYTESLNSYLSTNYGFTLNANLANNRQLKAKQFEESAISENNEKPLQAIINIENQHIYGGEQQFADNIKNQGQKHEN